MTFIDQIDRSVLRRVLDVILGLAGLCVGVYFVFVCCAVANNHRVSDGFYLSRGILAFVAFVLGAVLLYGGFKNK